VVVDYGVTGGVLLVVSEMYEHWFVGVQYEISVLMILKRVKVWITSGLNAIAGVDDFHWYANWRVDWTTDSMAVV
jgi:hypothetical protein